MAQKINCAQFNCLKSIIRKSADLSRDFRVKFKNDKKISVALLRVGLTKARAGDKIKSNMEKSGVAKLIVKLIGYAVFNDAVDIDVNIFDEKTVKFLYEFAGFHEILPIVSYALDKLGVKGEGGIYDTVRQETYFTVMHIEGLEYLHKRTEQVLSDSGIDHIMLKGSLIRRLYPVAYMRTGSDVDVLVRECDYSKSIDVLSSALGMRIATSTTHDTSLFSDAMGHLEVHRTLIDETNLTEAIKLLDNIWCYTTHDGCRYSMTKEAFIFYHVVHMAKHIVGGGCGIRFFIDLKLILDDGYDEKLLNELLDKAKIKKFFDSVVGLEKYWFEGAACDDTTKELGRYVMSGGIYGRTDNMVAARGAKTKGKLRYAVSRIFLPYDKLKLMYPSLKGKRVLTPVYQVRRWLRALFRGKFGRRIKEYEAIGNVSAEYAERIYNLMVNIGLE